LRSLRLARRELASLRAEKTVILAILVQLAIAAFSSLLFVGLVSLYTPAGGGAGVVVDVGVTGNATDVMAPVVADDSSRSVSTFTNRTEALEAFSDGRIDAVLVGTTRPEGNITVEAIAPEGDFRTTLVVVQVRDALATLERTLRDSYSARLTAEPVTMPDAVGGSPFFGFAYTVLVPLLVLMPAFISGSIVVDSLSEEIDRGTLDLLRVAPVSLGDIVDGKAMAAVGIAPLQAVAWLLLLAANGTLVARPFALIVMVTAFATLFVALGAVLAVGLQDRRSGQLLYSISSLGAIALITLLPEGPVNTVAKLAIGSPTATSYATVAAVTLVAVMSYGVARRLSIRFAPHA
jgi:ABC-2 type transport system permease protein